MKSYQKFTESSASNIINEQDVNGNTMLHKAVKDNNPTDVKFLLQQGADINIVNNNGNTPLLSLQMQRKDKNNLLVLEELLKAGADVNQRSEYGTKMTLVMFAARYNDPDLIEALLKAGADPFIKNTRGEDLFDFLTSYHITDIIENKFPHIYQNYIMRQDANKYNL